MKSRYFYAEKDGSYICAGLVYQLKYDLIFLLTINGEWSYTVISQRELFEGLKNGWIREITEEEVALLI